MVADLQNLEDLIVGGSEQLKAAVRDAYTQFAQRPYISAGCDQATFRLVNPDVAIALGTRWTPGGKELVGTHSLLWVIQSHHPRLAYDYEYGDRGERWFVGFGDQTGIKDADKQNSTELSVELISTAGAQYNHMEKIKLASQ